MVYYYVHICFFLKCHDKVGTTEYSTKYNTMLFFYASRWKRDKWWTSSAYARTMYVRIRIMRGPSHWAYTTLHAWAATRCRQAPPTATRGGCGRNGRSIQLLLSLSSPLVPFLCSLAARRLASLGSAVPPAVRPPVPYTAPYTRSTPAPLDAASFPGGGCKRGARRATGRVFFTQRYIYATTQR
jgi:hypothetical protein